MSALLNSYLSKCKSEVMTEKRYIEFLIIILSASFFLSEYKQSEIYHML